MTTRPKSTDLLPVTTTDREAAADLRTLLPPLAGSREIAAMRDGDLDDSAYVQAFARHRISHAILALLPASPAQAGYAGLPMSDADLEKHYEASKCDVVDLVGSEVRQIIGELRYYRAHSAQAVAPPGWRSIESYEPDNLSVIVATSAGYVGEAAFRSSGDSDDGWWWANEGPGDYYAEKLEISCGGVTHWVPLPDAPAALTTPDEQRGEG